MIRTRGSSKLSTSERKNLILELCEGLCSLKSPEEVAQVLTDLLSPKEIEIIAKRLKIAQLLSCGCDYEAIREELKVGYSTVARVNSWLNLAGEGFKILLDRRKNKPSSVTEEERYDPYSWYNIKRRYTLSFWPQLLLEELFKVFDEKEKKKINQVLDKINLNVNSVHSEKNKKAIEYLLPRTVAK